MPTQLFLERSFDPAITADDVHALARNSGWCFKMYKVDWCASLLATGGRKMVCWFVAPDTESARMALRKSGADTRRLWTGTIHEANEPVIPNVAVERSFEHAVALQQIQSIEDAGAWCLRTHRVKFARTVFSADRKRMLCFYAAPDAESVRVAQQQAGMPFDAVWSFQRLGPDTLPTKAG